MPTDDLKIPSEKPEENHQPHNLPTGADPDQLADLLEGKGEEMIPERGLPFDDFNTTPVETAPDEPARPAGETQPPAAQPNLDEMPTEDAFPETLGSDDLLNFFDTVEENYSPVLDVLEIEDDETDRQNEPRPSTPAEIELPQADEAFLDDEIPAPSDLQDDETALYEEAIPFNPGNEALVFEPDDEEAIFAAPESDAIFESEADQPFAPADDEIPFLETEIPFDSPPPDTIDSAMESIHEEHETGSPPAQPDEGMSAGYPPTPDVGPTAMPNTALFSTAAFETPGPMAHLPDEHNLSHDHAHEHKADPKLVARLVPEDKIEALWIRADKARQGVNEHISTITIAQKMLDYIQTARNEMLGGQSNYEEAERYINEVEYRIALNKRLKDISKGYVAWLYGYEIFWAVVFLGILILYLGTAAFESTAAESTARITYMIGSMVWGGLGGVIGALLSLVKHISIEQDFDKQHTWWYIHSPLMGVGTGAVVFLFMHVGLNSIIGPNGEISSPFVIYVLAWLSGYQHNIFTDLVKRMMKTLMGDDKKDETMEDNLPKAENQIKG